MASATVKIVKKYDKIIKNRVIHKNYHSNSCLLRGIMVWCYKGKKGGWGSDVLRSRVRFFENLSSVDCGRLPMADILIYAPCFKHGAKDDLGNIEAEAADRNTNQVDF